MTRYLGLIVRVEMAYEWWEHGSKGVWAMSSYLFLQCLQFQTCFGNNVVYS